MNPEKGKDSQYMTRVDSAGGEFIFLLKFPKNLSS